MQLKPWTASAFVLLCCTAFAEPQVVIVHANVFTADTVHREPKPSRSKVGDSAPWETKQKSEPWPDLGHASLTQVAAW